MRERPVPWQKYRHFKGGLYQVIAIATHTETDEEMVVYQALYGDYRIFCRPLSMFMSETGEGDSCEYRFTPVSDGGGNENDTPNGIPGARVSYDAGKTEIRTGENGAGAGLQFSVGVKEEQDPGIKPHMANDQSQRSSVMSKTIEEEAAELGMDPRVVAFLDADLASERLSILDSLRGMATNDMIDIMAMAAGFDIEEGEPWDRFAELRECLRTVERFETSRLR